jgi:hypothetical protein
MGHEIDWAPDGTYTPETDDVMNYRRAICNQRPYLLLMHTNYEALPPECMELWMKRSAAYGFFPSPSENRGGAGEYWENPRLYNRDRPLFKKYIPVIKALSAAGWEPVTCARSSNPQVYVERFGEPGGPLYFTVFNDSHQPQTAVLQVEAQPLGLNATSPTITEVLSGESIRAEGGGFIRLSLGPEDVKVLQVAGPR